MTLAEQIQNEGASDFEAIKEQLVKNVMDGIRMYGHHQIYFGCSKDRSKITLSRFPNGSDCTTIHITFAVKAQEFLRKEGLNVVLDRWAYDNSPRVLNVSI